MTDKSMMANQQTGNDQDMWTPAEYKQNVVPHGEID